MIEIEINWVCALTEVSNLRPENFGFRKQLWVLKSSQFGQNVAKQDLLSLTMTGHEFFKIESYFRSLITMKTNFNKVLSKNQSIKYFLSWPVGWVVLQAENNASSASAWLWLKL